MSDHAIIHGDLEEVKFIKTRKTVQFIIEVPVERADTALEALGGFPIPGESRPVAIARLKTGEGVKPKGGPICKQAAMLCKNQAFTVWLAENRRPHWDWALQNHNGDTEHVAKHVLYRLCRIKSRADLDHDSEAAATFERIQNAFHREMRGQSDEDMQRMQR